MKNHNVRLWIVTAVAIFTLTLFWGLRHMSSGLDLANKTLSQSLDQEVMALQAATRAAIQAVRFQLLDVSKAEIAEHQNKSGENKPTKAFSSSMFSGLAIYEWEQKAWKLNWLTVTPSLGGQLNGQMLREKMKEWPEQGTEQMQFHRLQDVASQPYFAAVMPVARGASKLLIVGVFQPSQFPLTLASQPSREVMIVNDHGYALGLSHPAYLGSSLRQQNFVQEILSQDELSAKKDFTAAARLAESNLWVIVEAMPPALGAWRFKSILFLLFSGLIASGLTWWVLQRVFGSTLSRVNELEEQNLYLQQQLSARNSQTAPVKAMVLEEPQEIPKAVPSITQIIEEEEFVDPRINLGEILKTAGERFQNKFSSSKVDLRLEGLNDLRILGDEPQLKTALEEILKNAFESLGESPRKAVTVKGENLADRIRVTIQDTGSGISPMNLGKVFDPFFTTKDTQGVARGLGLNVVRRVVDEANGKVNITSNEGGTKVEVELPIDPSHNLDQEATTGAVAEPDFQMLNLDFHELEKKEARPMPRASVRKPKVRGSLIEN